MSVRNPQRIIIGKRYPASVLDRLGYTLSSGNAVVLDAQHFRFQTARSVPHLKEEAYTLKLDHVMAVGIQLLTRTADGDAEFDVWV